MPPVFVLLLALAATPDPVDVGDRKQLFIDDRFLAERDGIQLRVNPPQKLGLLRDERDTPIQGHVSRVIEDGGKSACTSGPRTLRSSKATTV